MNDHINKYESFMFLETKNDKKKKKLKKKFKKKKKKKKFNNILMSRHLLNKTNNSFITRSFKVLKEDHQ